MGNSKRGAFQFIFDKVLSRIDGWRAKTLSQAGILVFLKSVAATITSYTMSTFMFPINLCTILDKSLKNFLWGFPPNKTKNLSLKAWDSICLHKDLGGLGIRKMRKVNLALISKLGWKLLCKVNICGFLNSKVSISSQTLFFPPPFLLPLGCGKVS
jgi:hypothetical protein